METLPVLVGVGQVNDRPECPADGLDPIDLMAAALRRAEEDADGEWLIACDSLAVVRQIGWPHLDPADNILAEKLGIDPAHHEQTALPNGDSPVRLLHEAANCIGAGQATICAIAGAEALRTAAQLAAAKKDSEAGEKPDALRDAAHRRRAGYAQSHGLVLPVDVYPLYENALRARLGQSLAEGQAESGAIWAALSQVAAKNQHAWLREAVSAEEIVTPSPGNRPVAFPYTKLQVANASVNQGAAFLITSLAEARRRGVLEDRIVYIGYGAAAHEDADFLQRDSYAASPSLETSIHRTMELNRLSTSDLDFVELYSCFPCIPKLARRVLDWPVGTSVSVFGGLTFGGGPIGNYMSHAIASMADKLRRERGKGLLFANGGYATHNHTILLSSDPLDLTFPQNFDYQAEADARRGPIPPLDKAYAGPATIETYTVRYARDGLVDSGTVVARTPDGGRTLALVPAGDEQTIGFLTNGGNEPVGTAGTIARDKDGLGIWSSSLVPGGL